MPPSPRYSEPKRSGEPMPPKGKLDESLHNPATVAIPVDAYPAVMELARLKTPALRAAIRSLLAELKNRGSVRAIPATEAAVI